MTWEDRLTLLRRRLGRELSLDEMLAEAKNHKMTPGEVQVQRESFCAAFAPVGDGKPHAPRP